MNTFDKMEKVGNSLIQHGSANDRVYVMKTNESDVPDLIDHVHNLLIENDYTKVFAKVPVSLAEPFLAEGYDIEAMAPRMFRGKEAALFLAHYPAPATRRRIDRQAISQVVRKALSKRRHAKNKALPDSWTLRRLTPEDANSAADLYRTVFASYPFPIHDPSYLVETMNAHINYFGVWKNDKLIALASAERDNAGGNAEMTDFATRPDARGMGLATTLLHHMESALRQEGFFCLYTIARALSMGMNCTFGKLGYAFGGTLRNNTQIAGNLESMNVWYKNLQVMGS
jgi:beta-lysine N6-acetyltransferase